MFARAFAPNDTASFVISSMSFLENLAPPGILIPRTIPPFSRVSLTILNSDCKIISPISNNSNPKRVSGLSEPNLSIASCQGIWINGGFTSTPAALKVSTIKPSTHLITSCCSTKDISRSIWVNSGCLSARKSSSRKHFAIW